MIHDIAFSAWWSAFALSQQHGVVYDCTFTNSEHYAYFEGYPDGVMGSHPQLPWGWDSQHSFVFEDCTFGETVPKQIMFVNGISD